MSLTSLCNFTHGRSESTLFETATILPAPRIKSYRNKIVPEPRLCGNGLEKAGFSPKNYVSVTVMNGLLVIRSTTIIDE